MKARVRHTPASLLIHKPTPFYNAIPIHPLFCLLRRAKLADTASIVENTHVSVGAAEFDKEGESPDGATPGEPPGESSDAVPDGSRALAEVPAAIKDEINESADAQDEGGGRDETKDKEGDGAAEGTGHEPAQAEGEGSAEEEIGLIEAVESSERSMSLVVVEIAVATFKGGEKVRLR